MEFSSYSTSALRHISAMIYQTRDRWLIIRLESLPNLLLESGIVESLTIRAAEIMKLDNEYMTQKPEEFVDEHGVRWLKAPK